MMVFADMQNMYLLTNIKQSAPSKIATFVTILFEHRLTDVIMLRVYYA